jgi:hypothetical protein
MRGVAPFDELWARRTEIESDGVVIPLLSLPDLVAAKKTQRAKDWPMIERLVERSYLAPQDPLTPGQIAFWLAELRTPELLIEAVKRFPAEVAKSNRSAVVAAFGGKRDAIDSALHAEQSAEREADEAYWIPLKRELETLRRQAT